jgi:hypothetical protein
MTTIAETVVITLTPEEIETLTKLRGLIANVPSP